MQKANWRMSAVVALVMLLLPAYSQEQEVNDARGGGRPPVLKSVTPNNIPAGSGDTSVTMTGSGFKNPIVAQWNNALTLSTRLVSSTRISATIPADQLVQAGTGSIRALQGQQGNQTATSSLTIAITSPTPQLTSVSPQHGVVGAPPVPITLTGSNFVSSSVVNWTAGTTTTALTSTFVSATQLTATVPTSLLVAVPKTASITVANGAQNSVAVTFTIVPKLQITTTTLPGGSVGSPYSAQLNATGGTTPYTWSVFSGTLPPGLTLNSSTGLLAGTPTTTGQSNFTIQCADSTGGLAKMSVGKKEKKKKE